MVNKAVKHVLLDQPPTDMVGETIKKHVDNNFKASKTAEGIARRMLGHDDFFAGVALLVQTKTLHATASQQKVDLLGSTSMANCSRKNAPVLAECSLLHDSQHGMSSESSGEERNHRGKIHQPCQCTRSSLRQNRIDRSRDSPWTL